jgi:hypothetical protein
MAIIVISPMERSPPIGTGDGRLAEGFDAWGDPGHVDATTAGDRTACADDHNKTFTTRGHSKSIRVHDAWKRELPSGSTILHKIFNNN